MSHFFEMYSNRRDESRSSNYFEKEKKFNKNDPRDQQLALKFFKDMIGASMDFALKDKSCCLDDDFLKRFLFARKFDCEEAMQLLINYLSFKEQHKGFLQKINIFDDRIRLALDGGNPSVLHQRDRRGRKVLIFNAANWDPLNCSLEDVFRALLLTLDKLLENVQNQALGFVVIVDWTNFTYRQSLHLSLKTLKLMIEALQDCIPAKFKGIHFIEQPWYVDIAKTLIKQFLKDKIKERFVTHGSNLTSLHQLICKDILPPDLGDGPHINTLDWYHYLLESSQTPEVPKSYRFITTTEYTKIPSKITIPQDSCSSNKNNEDFTKVVVASNESNGLSLIS